MDLSSQELQKSSSTERLLLRLRSKVCQRYPLHRTPLTLRQGSCLSFACTHYQFPPTCYIRMRPLRSCPLHRWRAPSTNPAKSMLSICHHHSTCTRPQNRRNASATCSKKRHSRRGRLKARVGKVLRQQQLELQIYNVHTLTASPFRSIRKHLQLQILDHRLRMAFSIGQHHARFHAHLASALTLDHSVAKKERTPLEGARTCHESTQLFLDLKSPLQSLGTRRL